MTGYLPRTPVEVAKWLVQYRNSPTPKLPTHAECVALARAYLGLVELEAGNGTLSAEGQIHVTSSAADRYMRHAPGLSVGAARLQLHRHLLDARQDPDDLALWRYRTRAAAEQIDLTARVVVDEQEPRLLVVTAVEARTLRR